MDDRTAMHGEQSGDPGERDSDAASPLKAESRESLPSQGRRKPFFSRLSLLFLAALTLLLLLSIALAWRTSSAMASMPFLHLKRDAGAGSDQHSLVDQTPWQTAVALHALAMTQEELAFADQAERLAGHEVDQAFASALRSANLTQRTLSGPARDLQQRVTQLEQVIDADQDAVKAATPKGGDDLAVAQAQLALDQDDLSDARADLTRASGDPRPEIQQELTAYTAEETKLGGGGAGEDAVTSAKRYRTLVRFLGAYNRQNTRYALILEAENDAEQAAKALSAQHNQWEHAGGSPAAADTQSAGDRIERLNRLALQRQLMSLADDRISTEQQLASVYAKWAVQVELQHRILRHLIAIQMIWIAAILLAATLLSAGVRRLTERESLDARRARTLARISRLGIQVVALLSVLLVTFGPPEHISTVVGLTTAGLTVALQDFILAFVGWFLLMGRNGLGVGDVVEINSVTGQVVEIGLFRTTLLETGNWTAKGHPTGRRVDFNNKFAISGQYFNFSTAGQWMWDELTVSVPADENPYAAIERVHKAVADETEEDARVAETEWQRSSRHYSLSQFTAEPDVNVRPSSSGVDLVVRYVTRATNRFERRNKLYQCVLEALQAPKAEASS